jgi:predicted PurR-regulated permease PerM
MFDPAVTTLEQLRLPRRVSTLLLIVAGAGLLTSIVLIIYPAVSLQVELLASELPYYLTALQEWLTPLLKRVVQKDPDRMQTLLRQILQRLEDLPMRILGGLSTLVGTTLASLGGVLEVALNLFVIPVATFYLLRDFGRMRVALPAFLPITYRLANGLWRNSPKSISYCPDSCVDS